MGDSPRSRDSTSGYNHAPFAIMSGGWLGPLVMFWLYIWGPLRPSSYPEGVLLPGAPFGFLILACIGLWWLPDRYFRIRNYERSGRLYELFRVREFRRFAPDGDLANRWARKSNPQHKMITGRRSALGFVERTKQNERGHLVLFALGIVSAGFAFRIGWYGWAWYLTAGNVFVNVYPIILQRYTRSRILAVLNRSRKTDGLVVNLG